MDLLHQQLQGAPHSTDPVASLQLHRSVPSTFTGISKCFRQGLSLDLQDEVAQPPSPPSFPLLGRAVKSQTVSDRASYHRQMCAILYTLYTLYRASKCPAGPYLLDPLLQLTGGWRLSSHTLNASGLAQGLPWAEDGRGISLRALHLLGPT